jgi:DNA polymerase-3 subunit epsilon
MVAPTVIRRAWNFTKWAIGWPDQSRVDDAQIGAIPHLAPASKPEPAPQRSKILPSKVLFVDVETTGLRTSDRIVTFAGLLLETAPLTDHTLQLNFVHCIFDPGKKSHPQAELVHGYSDWLLRHQDPFSEYADEIDSICQKAELVVAHNVEFDIGFINRELEAAGKTALSKPIYCTMSAHRRAGIPGPANLVAVAARLGLARSGETHSALEDAWLAMLIFLAQHGYADRADFAKSVPNPHPLNLRPAPPLPDGPLPRRKRRSRPAATS